MKKKYKIRAGLKLKGISPQVVGETIENLRNKRGHVTTQEILDSAKDMNSPIHDYFDWEDTKAAEQWRLSQARQLVSTIVEVVYLNGDAPMDRRSFHSVHDKDLNGEPIQVFVTLQDVIENESYRKQLLTKAITILENLTDTMKLLRKHEK